uniref:Dipeptidylpeptidase IV N-terminal domain-containing protein n=1 Tax=Ascaris lumbricoides TaxID=6252 RepID=A0A9J2Q2X7_ASCLU
MKGPSHIAGLQRWENFKLPTHIVAPDERRLVFVLQNSRNSGTRRGHLHRLISLNRIGIHDLHLNDFCILYHLRRIFLVKMYLNFNSNIGLYFSLCLSLSLAYNTANNYFDCIFNQQCHNNKSKLYILGLLSLLPRRSFFFSTHFITKTYLTIT